MPTKLKNNVLLYSIIIFILAFSIRVYYIGQKSGVHIDTLVTASVISCKFDQDLYFFPKQNITYTGEELKDLTIPAHHNLKRSLSELNTLRVHNCGDTSQPNLYYMIFKIFTFPAKKFDIPTLIKYGCTLNLLIFCCSFALMYKLLSELFKDNKFVIPLGLAAAFLNTGSISMTLLIRMYEFQGFAAIFLTYMLIQIYQSIDRKENSLSIKNIFLYALASLICIDSGYFMGIYFGIIFLALLGNSLIKKQYKITLYLFISMLLTCLSFLFIYPQYFNALLDPRAPEIFTKLNHPENFNNILDSALALFSHFRFFILYIPVILICLLSLFWARKDFKYNKMLFFIFSLNFIWILIISYISPIKVVRYVYASFPVFSLVIPYIISYLKGYKRHFTAIAVILVYLFYSLSAQSTEWHYYFTEKGGYRYFNPTYDLFSSHIENLYKDKPDFVNHPDIPVLFMLNNHWQYTNLVYYLNDRQKYEFYYLPYREYRDFNKLSKEGFDKYLRKYKEYYLITAYAYWESAEWKHPANNFWYKDCAAGYLTFDTDTLPKEYKIKNIERFGLVTAYLINYKANK